jgi:ATP-dependent RNA helicase MSS116
MLATLRRCPASLSRNLPSAALSVRVIRGTLSQPSPLVWRTAARVPKITVSSFHHSAKWQQVEATATTDAAAKDGGLITQFEDLRTRGLVHPNVIDTITKQMKLQTMTDVQTRTINEALSGVDMYASFF